MDITELKPAHVRRIKSLALLSDKQLESFLNCVELVVLEHSANIFKERERGDSMFLILDGEVRVFSKQKNGEILFLRALQAGDAFGEIALLTQGPRSASAEAMKQSLLLKISAASLQKLMRIEPALAAQFLYHLARSLGRQLTDLTTRLRTQRDFGNAFSFIR
jgi:CRP-like cAMP-binding protein